MRSTVAALATLSLVVVGAASCGGDDDARSDPTSGGPTTAAAATRLVVTSSDFGEGEPIPREFTCDGDNAAPDVSWTGVPAATEELEFLVDDPDAPGGTFLHWRVRLANDETSAPVAGEGETNDAGARGYAGPCPPPGDGPHHYRFTVTAFDATGAELARGSLTGTYER